ncbi:hypothetical protein [Arachnia propionica]|uniref:hypothetical protein n=1 Tax=Arachnia propionica TaxID=1750 RepID=UPI00163A95DB|nr:hypothetical protein [Arachnia propionica]
MHFNAASVKYIGLFDEDKHEKRHVITKPNERVRTRGHGHDAWDVPTVAEIHAINEKLNTPVRTPGEDRVPA